MATSLQVFEKLQLGIEVVSTKGTIVPATVQILGNHMMLEQQEVHRDNHPRGFRSNVGGAGIIMSRAVTLDVDTELSAEDVLWPLTTGVRGSVAPSTSDTTAKTYVFTPELTTGVAVVQSASGEFVRGDGVTNHYTGKSGYLMTESFRFEWAFNQIAKMSWKMFGRARQTGAPTGSLVPYTTREALASNLLSVYWDTTWAGLGGTQLTGILRSAILDVTTGYKPDYTMEGRADADMTNHKVGIIGSVLNLVMEFDSLAAAKYVQWRANEMVFVRLKNTGSLAGAATALRTVQVDGAYVYTGPPTFSVDGEQVLMSVQLVSTTDTPTSLKSMEFTSISKLATL